MRTLLHACTSNSDSDILSPTSTWRTRKINGSRKLISMTTACSAQILFRAFYKAGWKTELRLEILRYELREFWAKFWEKLWSFPLIYLSKFCRPRGLRWNILKIVFVIRLGPAKKILKPSRPGLFLYFCPIFLAISSRVLSQSELSSGPFRPPLLDCFH